MRERMSAPDGVYSFEMFFGDFSENVIFDSKRFKRIHHVWNDECSQLIDVHSTHGMRIHHLRVSTDGAPKKLCLSSAGTILKVSYVSELGTLLRVDYEKKQYTVWLPSAFGLFRIDENQRLSPLDSSVCTYQWEISTSIELNLFLSGNIRGLAVIPYVVVEDPHEQLAHDLTSLHQVEKRLYRKSDWFFAKSPSDVWNYLINGSIYDSRSQKGIDKRFQCQQCAFSWWNYFGLLYKETGKVIYDLMQDEISYSILLDMAPNGEWGHGYWSNEIETHARFHLDGIHLFISQFEKTGQQLWLEAAERSMTFVLRHLMEQLDDGSLWFLHDTNEHSQHHHFQSTLFGKTFGNSFCINTHVQALTVLFRLSLVIDGKQNYREMFESGIRALHRVLDCQPAEGVYKLLMDRLMKWKTRKSAQSLTGKLRNALEGFLIPRIFWLVRRQFPRIVFPGGFTERDLTLSFFSDRYHIINLKDLLTLYQQTPLPWLRSYIKDGFSFSKNFLNEIELAHAIESSPYYIEIIDIFYLYSQLIENVKPDEMDVVKNTIYEKTGGCSLDYYASGLVRGKPEDS